MPVCHSQVLKTDHSSHIQWVLFLRRNALAHRFLLCGACFFPVHILSKTQGGITIGIWSMFGKKGHFGPRLVSLILHLAACSCLISMCQAESLKIVLLDIFSMFCFLLFFYSFLSLFLSFPVFSHFSHFSVSLSLSLSFFSVFSFFSLSSSALMGHVVAGCQNL